MTTRRQESKKKRGDNEGSIFTVRGRWRAQLPYRTNTGVRRFLTKSFETKGEADTWITEQKHHRFQGSSVTPDKRTVGVFLDEWLDLAKPDLAPKTYRTYSDFVKLHLKPGLGNIRLQQLTALHVTRWLAAKRAENKYTHQTIKHMRDTLRAALNKAVKPFEYLRTNPVLSADLPKKSRTAAPPNRRFLEPDEARAFLKAIEKHPDGVLFRLILSLGLRKGEALGLKLDSLFLDQDPPMVHIQRSLQAIGGKLVLGPVKREKSNRKLPLPAGLATALRKHLERRAAMKEKAEKKDLWVELGFVFTTRHGAPVYPRNLTRSLAGVLKAANLQHFRVHDLRHSAATLAIADGVPVSYVSAMLGHTDNRTTLNLYVGVIPAVLQHATGTLDRVMAGQKPVTDFVTDGKIPKKAKHRVKP